MNMYNKNKIFISNMRVLHTIYIKLTAALLPSFKLYAFILGIGT